MGRLEIIAGLVVLSVLRGSGPGMMGGHGVMRTGKKGSQTMRMETQKTALAGRNKQDLNEEPGLWDDLECDLPMSFVCSKSK